MNNQEFQSTQILPTTVATDDSSTFCAGDSLAAAPVTLEIKKDSTIPGLDCGAKCSASSRNVSRYLYSSKILRVCSIADLTESCLTLTPSGTMQSGIVSLLHQSACHTTEKESSLLPTPMAYSTKSSRPPGQTKLEIRLRKYGSLLKTEAINPEFLRWLMGFPLE